MSTGISTQDRHAVSTLNVVASGHGLRGTPANRRDASRPMSAESLPWKSQPTRVPVPTASSSSLPRRQIASISPYTNSALRDTLGVNHKKGPLRARAGLEVTPGNNTATKTILGAPGFEGRKNEDNAMYRSSPHPHKRQKTSHPSPSYQKSSAYFKDGAQGTSKSKGKGKGKEPHGQSASDAETISDEDTGQSYPRNEENNKGRRLSQSPDPLDVIDQPSSEVQEGHDFDKAVPIPSRRPNSARLPPDGSSTVRLKEKMRNDPQIVTIIDDGDDGVSDDVQSASGFDVSDREFEARGPVVALKSEERRATTPSGRSKIPVGLVQGNIKMFETNGPSNHRKEPPSKSKSDEPVRTIDFNEMKPKSQSRKSQMKGKNQKPASKPGPSDQPSHVGHPLDDIATSSSGFRKNNKRSSSVALPLQAWSFGCHLDQSEDGPVAWLTTEFVSNKSNYVLKVLPAQATQTPLAVFRLSQDFSAVSFTDPASEWEPDTVAVIKLKTTRSVRPKSQDDVSFQPGVDRPLGWVSFKFLLRHANWQNGQAYKELVGLLKAQIHHNHEVLRGVASDNCWDYVAQASEMMATRDANRTSTSAPISRRSPLSTGPAIDDSTTMPPSTRSSVSAPPPRTYGTERRATRQSARSSRRSPSPDLDPDELLLVYPQTGTGAVNITRADLKRLDDGQYLNDTIIEFGLKLWMENLRQKLPELADQVHVFNSFFYKKLSSKKEVADAYPSVRKWSSKVDIFSKKYIIVPINENFHWYLAIIENPANMLHPPPPEALLREAPQTRKRKRESAVTEIDELVSEDKDPPMLADSDKEATAGSSKRSSEQPEPRPPDVPHDVMVVDGESEEGQVESILKMTQLSVDDNRARSQTRDHSVDLENGELQYPGSEEPMDVDVVPNSEADEGKTTRAHAEPIVVEDDADMVSKDGSSESVESDAKPETKHKQSAPLEENVAAELGSSVDDSSKYQDAYIYTFDSLGSKHPAAANRLAKYLRFEAVDKKGLQLEETRLAVVKHAKSPLQTNFCDCGLFVLAFVEVFMDDPVRAGELIRESKADWYVGRKEDFRKPFRDRTVQLSELWKAERAAKEEAKTEVTKGDNTDNGEKENTTEKAEKAKDKESEAIPIEDSDDDIVISEVRPAPKATRGGKKATSGKAATSGRAERLRG